MANRFGAFNPDSIFSSGVKFKLGHVERVFNTEEDLKRYNKSYNKTFSNASQIIEYTPYSKNTKSNRRKRYKLAHPLYRGFSDSITHGDLVLYCNIEEISFYIGPVNTNNNPNNSSDFLYIPDENDNIKDSGGYNKLVPRANVKKTATPTNKNLEDPNEFTSELSGSLIDYESRVSDVIIEGRYNNHIRIGNRNVAPIVEISNGVGENQTGDGSKILMSALGGIDDHLTTIRDGSIYNYSLSSETVDSKFDYMQGWYIGMGNNKTEVNPSEFYEYGPVLKRVSSEDKQTKKFSPKHQIFITSERIVFDAYGVNGDLTLSSKRNINFGAGENFTLTNKGFTVIQSKNIYLGEASKERTQPMVLGNELNNLLKEIMDIIQSAHALVQGIPIPLVDSGGNLLLPKINEVVKKLDVQIERNYNDDESIPEGDRITGPAHLSHHHFIEENR